MGSSNLRRSCDRARAQSAVGEAAALDHCKSYSTRITHGSMTGADQIFQRVRSHALRLAKASGSISKVADAVGAHTVSDKLDRARSHNDIVAIRLPPKPGSFRTNRVKMLRQHGNDQAAEAMARGGWFGYEAPLPDLVVESVRHRPGAFFDIGANTGLYGLLALRARRDVDVYAFEPYPPVREKLEDNLMLNYRSHRIRIIDAAVAETSGHVSLFIPEPTYELVETSCSLLPDFKDDSAPAAELTVPCVTLDEFWHEIKQPNVSAIKVDAEGADVRVLEGAVELLSEKRPILFYEVLPGADFPRLRHVADSVNYMDARLNQREIILGDEIRYDDDARNHALIPTELRSAFVEMATKVGVVVTQI
jgi:FkbM family methyltransferase